MKHLFYLLAFLFATATFAQNCDSVIIIHHTYDDDGTFYDYGFEIDSINNGVVINKSINNVIFEYNSYDSFLRRTSVVNLNSNDSTTYSYDVQSRIIQTNYFHNYGSGWVFNNDTSRSSNFFTSFGKDSLYARYKWNGTTHIPFYQRVYTYSANDTLVTWEIQTDTGGGFQTDTTGYVYWISGIRNDTVRYNSDPGDFVVFGYDSLQRLILTDDYVDYFGELGYETYDYHCGIMNDYYSSCNGCHSGTYFYATFDSLCRFAIVYFGHGGTSASYSHVLDYYYVDCNNMAMFLSQDSTICQDDSTSIVASVWGGTGPYSIQWSPSTGLSSDSSLFVLASPDSTTNYIITISDTSGHSISDSVKITVKNTPYENLHILSVDTFSACQSVTLTTDSVFGFSYYWVGDPLYLGNKHTLIGIRNGMYHLIVSNYNYECPAAEDSIQISFLNNPVLPIVNISKACNMIVAHLSYPCTIKWYKNYQLMQGVTNDTLQGMTDGNYSVFAFDSLGCDSVGQYISYTQGDYHIYGGFSCPDSCNGALSIQTNNSSSLSNITWSGGQTTSYINHLCQGVYSVTIIDQNGCVNVMNNMVVNYPVSPVSMVSTGASGISFCDGMAFALDSLNHLMNVNWDDSTSSIINDSLCPGWHYVFVVPNYANCPQLDSVFVASVPSTDTCSIIFSVQQPLCNGNNGSATAGISTGTPVYWYWTGNFGFHYFGANPSLSEGTYTCIVINSNGCRDTGNVTINPSPLQLSTTYSFFQSTCKDSCRVQLNVSGGSPPYNYQWCNGDTTSFLDSCVSSCQVTIKDVNQCVLNYYIGPQPASPMYFLAYPKPASCMTCNDGMYVLNIYQGTHPYSITMDSNPVANDDTISNVLPGIHMICVYDSLSCSICQSVNLSFATSVQDLSNDDELKVFPNPSNDFVKVKVNEEYRNARYSITDAMGKTVLFSKLKGVETHIQWGLSPGVYLLTIEGHDKSVLRKEIVVQ